MRFRGVLAAVVLLFVALGPRSAFAVCPDERDEPICEPFAGTFQPSLTGNAAVTNGLGSYLGGGLELVLLGWKNGGPTFGPSDGKIRLGVGVLASTRDSSRLMVPFRIGTALSFETRATRKFLVPYFAVDVGGIYESDLKTRMFADAGLGLYLLHTRTVSIDFEGTYVLPFSAVKELHGPKMQLTATFAVF